MPAIAAIDNETLDHLLSVVDDARNVTSPRALSKRAPATKPSAGSPGSNGLLPVAGSPEFRAIGRRTTMPVSWGNGARGDSLPVPCHADQIFGDQALHTSAALSAV